MTTFDRIERRLPEIIDGLASATVPDYFDDMLQLATQSRQRPAWSSLERWLPMGVIARPLPVRSLPWRLFAIVALVALLAAATLLYAGSRLRVLAPFGPARNGELVIGTAAGDIVTVDPSTGASTVLISGPTADGGPWFSNDGQRFIFDRKASPSASTSAMFVANADGSNVRELFPDEVNLGSLSWSPSGDRVLITPTIGGRGTISIVNVDDLTTKNLALDLDVAAATWRPNHDQIIVTAKVGDNVTFWVANADGSGKRQIAVSTYAINEPTLSPDGTKLAYATWEPTPLPGRIHVVDIDAGGDHSITTDDGDGAIWQTPQFSPDGTKIVVYRFIQGTSTPQSQISVIPTNGLGSPIVMGPVTENPPANPFFSPDGKQILAEYPTLKTFWIFDANGKNGHEAPFAAISGGGATWQRLAP
jgi:Tol biopolymer transport system component